MSKTSRQDGRLATRIGEKKKKKKKQQRTSRLRDYMLPEEDRLRSY